MKGIILAGGSGTRLHPITTVISKQLLPVYDKPMIYYPLSVLMLAGIRDVLIITTPHDCDCFKNLLGDGSNLGISIQYKEQPEPNGLAQAFVLGEEFIGDDCVTLILGDNIFYGSGLTGRLTKAIESAKNEGHTTIFGYAVVDPERFGIIEFDDDMNVLSIEEKPKKPKSNFCATGLYVYGKGVSEYAKRLKPSPRGEYEITDLNNLYLKEQRLKAILLSRGCAWLDTGTPESLLDAAEFIHLVEKRQTIKIAVLEEIAYQNGWITKEKLLEVSKKYGKSDYGKYLSRIAN